jgi:hypothetical protein
MNILGALNKSLVRDRRFAPAPQLQRYAFINLRNIRGKDIAFIA